VAEDLWVANMVAQLGLAGSSATPPIRYRAVEACLEAVAIHARNLGASVHMPRIGCGLAGGRWERVESIVERTLGARGIDVVVYDLPPRRTLDRAFSTIDNAPEERAR
jgi:O-acetyl-ADP-ribose deacetylase (regulator of RNase III)